MRKQRAWYEAVALQSDIQATISIHHLAAADSGYAGYVLEGRYGKISPYGKIGQKQIERGSLLLEMLEQYVQIALSEAGWNVRSHDNSPYDIWERVEEQPKEKEKP